jgi:Predicted transcriptional regulators
MSRSSIRFDAQRFKEIRLANGYTFASLSRAAGVSPSTIRHWEQGRYVPSMESLAIVMDVLQHSPTEVMNVPVGKATLADLRTLSLCPSQDAANALGLTLGAYSSLERGQIPLTPERIAILAKLFDVDEPSIVAASAQP